MHICMVIYMVKIISISDDTYQELSRRKAGRSFSETIRDLLRKEKMKGDIKEVSKFWGAFKDVDAASLKREVRQARTRSSQRNSRRL